MVRVEFTYSTGMVILGVDFISDDNGKESKKSASPAPTSDTMPLYPEHELVVDYVLTVVTFHGRREPLTMLHAQIALLVRSEIKGPEQIGLKIPLVFAVQL